MNEDTNPKPIVIPEVPDTYRVAQERVAEGVRWLDGRYVDWCDRIDLGRLNLNDVRSCMLGQLDGDYSRAMARKGLTHDDAQRLGFTTYIDDDEDGPEPRWEDLDAAWTEAIVDRRLARMNGGAS